MSNNKIKVVGYAQRVFYNEGIEYRNFSPDLVGLQIASNGNTPLFTMGSFSITTNLEAKTDKLFNTTKFSNFISLSDLDLTIEQTNTLLTDNASVILNLDKTNINYYSLFGSFSEFIRVSLESIITKWPASLYINPISQTPLGQTINGNTVEDYAYDGLTEISSFKINTTFINNKFEINYLESGNIINTFNETNDLRNFTVNYESYSVLYNNIEFPVLELTAATYDTNDYIYLKVKGNPFSASYLSLNTSYHIKPSKINEEKFFNTLPDFEYYLLNRNTIPLYTASFKFPIKSDDGIILYVKDTLSWPVNDGYNIDFDTTAYIDYVTKLLNISNNTDLVSSNLMNRFLVSESITAFDTTPVHLSDSQQDTSGQKVNKTLQIYGRELDEINKFISGIAFANTVTYDKQDNTPDVYLKNLARVLGWELVSSVLENDLLSSYVTTKASTYSGVSVGYTAVEADIELWKRLILNSPWLWKSKGSRKAIEFLLRFIGAPNGLIKFNEYIYKADGPIDVNLFQQVLELNGLDTDLLEYPIDSNGYPRPLPNTPDMYFQNYGLWYRETGGSGATIDILTGNNPHLGPYDGGYKYINQFSSLIPNFKPVTVSSETTTTTNNNLYSNYSLGTFDIGVTTATTVDTVQIVSDDNSDISDCVVFTPSIILDPNPSIVLNDCGCEVEDSDNVMSLCIDVDRNIAVNQAQPKCSDTLASQPKYDSITGTYIYEYYQYNIDGSIYRDSNNNPILNKTFYTSKECCSLINGKPFLYSEYNYSNPPSLINSGYVCCGARDGSRCGCTIACRWMVNQTPILLPMISQTYNGPQSSFLEFIKPNGSKSVVTPDGCNCISNLTMAVPNIIDPYTNEIGYGCQLNPSGINDLALGLSSVIYNFYYNKSFGKIPCYQTK